MRPDLSFASNLGPLWQLILGAFLATVGGFAATQLEWIFERRRRERNVALFFGELLWTLWTTLDIARETKKIGDPYGPVTLRLLRSARREIDLYERNRESLLDLREAALRARIHAIVIRISMPLDGIFDAAQEIGLLRGELKARDITEAEREEIAARLAGIGERREAGYDYMMENAGRIGALVADLEPLARQSFKSHADIVRNV